MNAVDRDNERFIRSHILCKQIGSQGVPVGFTHLSRLEPNQTWKSGLRARSTLCDTENYRTLAPIDRALDPRRDLAGICPQCREAYEAEARRRLGMPTAGQLVF